MNWFHKVLMLALPWVFEWLCERCLVIVKSYEQPRCPKCGELMQHGPVKSE
jgi:ABC-type ATPase with predicted acetyltransferase domain